MIDIWTNISIDFYINITNDKDIPINEGTEKIKEYLYKKITALKKKKKRY